MNSVNETMITLGKGGAIAVIRRYDDGEGREQPLLALDQISVS